ncbi:uncharacterized protein LOC129591660 [Paramacrobiotus metropolitanus]|uniref:uncharacterized protein LOC129591660 n=1 Tax=Paramacrobiotus metropolitanus TaxID=2943436 RepID=UPI002445F472|nr:uncharacterized protein LOC129591660 [Paramacrobiotus metropolitanus]
MTSTVERNSSLHRKVSFRRSDIAANFPDRRDSSRRKKTLLGKLSSAVQDFVADEEEVKLRLATICIHESVIGTMEKIADSFEIVHAALTNLRSQNAKLNETWNIYVRYQMMKQMIKDVLKLNEESSKILFIPQQDPGEVPLAYAQRLVNVINADKKASLDSSHLDPKKTNELKDKFDGVSIEEINEENNILHSDLFKMAKRYLNLRSLVNGLQQDYTAAKGYPFFPRYNMLRAMINDLMRSPVFIELCAEDMTQNAQTRRTK